MEEKWWRNGRLMVTVNSLTAQLSGVKDPVGVQNVSRFHEVVHVDRDLLLMRNGAQGILPGFKSPLLIRCFRNSQALNSEWKWEYWPEEAGPASPTAVR